MTTYVGSGEPGSYGDSVPSTSATMKNCSGLTLDVFDNLYIADRENHVIRYVQRYSLDSSILTSGYIYTFAGTLGVAGYSGDGDIATSALLNNVWGVAVHANGDVFIGDSGNYVIRKVTGGYGGYISTYFGVQSSSYCSTSTLSSVVSLAIDYYFLYICDRECGTIIQIVTDIVIPSRKLDEEARSIIPHANSLSTSSESIKLAETTPTYLPTASPTRSGYYIAGGGNDGIGYLSGVSSTSYSLVNIGMTGIAVYSTDTDEVYITSDDGTVRYTREGLIYTLYSSTNYCFGDCPRLVTSSVSYSHPVGVGVDYSGNIYFADQYQSYILEIFSSSFISYEPTAEPSNYPSLSAEPTPSPTSFYISKVAGTGISGYSGNGVALQSSLYGPAFPVLDSNGLLYFCDVETYRIRLVYTGIILLYKD